MQPCPRAACPESAVRSGRGTGWVEDLEQFGERRGLVGRGINDRAALLKRRRGPFLVLEADPAVSPDVDDDRVHRLDVEPHHTPAAADARAASSTPRTRVASGLPSPAPAYAYSRLTLASETSLSRGASEPGAFGMEVT